MKNKTLKKRLSLSSWIILSTGLIAAAAIYILASPEAMDNSANLLVSKKYIHDLEVYGGRANVIQDELLRWLEGLWEGKQLGVTIAFITGFIFLALRFLANPFRLNTPSIPGNDEISFKDVQNSSSVSGSSEFRNKKNEAAVSVKHKDG
jgi:hypothetical protein